MRVDNVSHHSYFVGMISNQASQGKPASQDRTPGRICPWWAGPLLCCPVRNWLESPKALLAPHVRPGMTVLEPGCGMGFFSLPLARMVGTSGRVVCVDVQPRMVAGLARRARRAGLSERITAMACPPGDLGVAEWTGRVDLAVAIHVVHEIGDPERFFRQIGSALRPGGRLFVLEPRGHVSPEGFEEEIAIARRTGLVMVDGSGFKRNHAALLSRPEVGQ